MCIITAFLECDLFWYRPHPWLLRRLPRVRMEGFSKKSYVIYTKAEHPSSNMAEAEQKPQWHLINQNQGRTSMGRIGCLCCSMVLKALRESMCNLGVPCGIDWADTEGQWHRCTSGECVGFYRLGEALWWEHRWGSKSTSVNKADLWILFVSNMSKSHQTSVISTILVVQARISEQEQYIDQGALPAPGLATGPQDDP